MSWSTYLAGFRSDARSTASVVGVTGGAATAPTSSQESEYAS